VGEGGVPELEKKAAGWLPAPGWAGPPPPSPGAGVGSALRKALVGGGTPHVSEVQEHYGGENLLTRRWGVRGQRTHLPATYRLSLTKGVRDRTLLSDGGEGGHFPPFFGQSLFLATYLSLIKFRKPVSHFEN